MTTGIPPCAAVIVAGGKSTRLGRDKASEIVAGRPMLQHVIDRLRPLCDEIIVVRAIGQQLPPLAAAPAVTVVDDAYPETGPLGGIFSGLRAAAADRCFAVACDMPLVSLDLARELVRRSAECDAVVPVRDRPEPLHAVYARACLEPMRRCIEDGRLRVVSFYGEVRTCYVRDAELRALDPDGRSFLNANTEDDLERVRRLLEGG